MMDILKHLSGLFNDKLAFDAPDGDWITMNGTPVKVNDNGKAVAGPSNVTGKTKSFDVYKKESNGDHYKAAQEFYKNEMMGKPVQTKIDGDNVEVQFAGGKDRKKMWQDLERDPVRAEALQHSREVIESGKYLGKSDSSKDDDRFVSYHYFQKEIPMQDSEGNQRKMIVDVGKKKDGAMEYRAHNFVHNKEPHYSKKVERLRGQGLQAEDKTIKKVGSIFSHGYSRPNQKNNLPTYDKTITPTCSKVNTDRLTFDASSKRTIDENGFLHVALCHVSKETVNPYYGYEVPGWQELKLDANKIYYGYRAGTELAKAAPTFNGLPLLKEHVKDSAENPQKAFRVGNLGTNASFTTPYLDNSLIIQDAEAIEDLNPSDPSKAAKRELSASYRYDPVFTSGVFNGQHYDFIMTNIRGNHVALVEEGRAGGDVVVADSQITHNKRTVKMTVIEQLKAMLDGLVGGATPPAKEGPQTLPTGDEDNTAAPVTEPMASDDEGGDLAKLEAYLATMEDKALAGQMREAIKAACGGGASDEFPDPEAKTEEKKEDKPAMDRKTVSNPKGKHTGQIAANFNIAMDSKAVASELVGTIRSELKAQVEAARAVRPLIGEVDPMAFDSAAHIYSRALELVGKPSQQKDIGALKELCAFACDAKLKQTSSYPVMSAAFANDSKAEADPNFRNINRIRRA